MPLDLSKLREQPLLDKETNPREIFNLLSEKDPKYKYPRDVQSEVWDRWLERRLERDLVLKMNTGGGKTIVGLLILKSCLNEQVGTGVYIAPDKYLVRQVLREAGELGISVATEPTSPAFLQGKSVLVTNIYQLINGKSVFGIADTGIKIPIGAVVIDDAHACLATTESQFTVTIPSDDDIFAQLLKLFRAELAQQSETKLLDIESGALEQEVLVPFWAWHKQYTNVAKIFAENRDHDSIKFNWPLIRNHLQLCRCVFSGGRVEISPRCLPIDAIPSFTEAKRRVFMTATLADDSILVSDFNASPDSVANHITPKIANDIGDRMILIPQEIDPDLVEDDIKKYLKKKSSHQNTVVIVPSAYRAEFWKDFADATATAENLEAIVNRLKNGHVGLVVLINKYDGIDLPAAACRILVLDGLPQARRLYERIETNMLAGSAHAIARQIQRIEQGMGRGIRANDDFCVVLLMGASLTNAMFVGGAKSMFSPATRAQLDKSNEVAGQLHGLAEIDEAVEICLKQDKEWKKVAREALANVSYPVKGAVRPIALTQRVAFDQASIRAFKEAEDSFQRLIDEAKDKENDSTIGWLKWQLAEYVEFRDAIRAQQILKSALSDNRRLTRPIDGIEYERLDAKNLQQAQNAAWKLRGFSGNANGLLIRVNGILDDLKFAPDNSDEFEAAMKEIAEFIGFKAQRPESDFKKGPDVLWAVGNLRYFVIECKSSSTVKLIAKHYANQLTGSAMWFAQRYDNSCHCVPILVHPSNVLEPAATAHGDARVMTEWLLPPFREHVRAFIKAAASNLDVIDAPRVQKLIEGHKLTSQAIIDSFTVAPKSGK